MQVKILEENNNFNEINEQLKIIEQKLNKFNFNDINSFNIFLHRKSDNKIISYIKISNDIIDIDKVEDKSLENFDKSLDININHKENSFHFLMINIHPENNFSYEEVTDIWANNCLISELNYIKINKDNLMNNIGHYLNKYSDIDYNIITQVIENEL